MPITALLVYSTQSMSTRLDTILATTRATVAAAKKTCAFGRAGAAGGGSPSARLGGGFAASGG